MKFDESSKVSSIASISARTTIILSAESYKRYAEANGFRQEMLEKVIRLGRVLSAVTADPVLSSKLALKGGTAINLMTEPIRRLSVDLDFNYIGAVERQAMLADKPKLLEAFKELASQFDFTVDLPRDEHGGSKFSLRYKNSLGTPDQIEIDVNWINRVPLGPVQRRTLWQPSGLEKPEVNIVSTEELVAGKLRALIDRVAARDVFDASLLPEMLPGGWPSREVKALFVRYTGTLSLPLTTYSVERLERLTASDYENKLLPVLNLGEAPERLDLINRAQNVLRPMLDLEPEQIEYVERLQKGEYCPELVLPFDPALAEKLRQHPALLWKAQNAKPHAQKKA